MDLDRRELLKGAVLSATTGAFALASGSSCGADTGSSQETAGETTRRPWKVVDANVHLFQWPFRNLPYDTTTALVEKLQSLQVEQAWAGSYEGILHRDLGGVNERLADACCETPQQLIPFGAVNPMLPGWEEDLRRCHETYKMPGIRLYPNYHGYTLEDADFANLMAIATERGLCVQIAVALEDRRTQHPKLQVPDVNLEPLPRLLSSLPEAKVMLLNYRPAGALAAQLAKVPGLFFDTARVESTAGIARWMQATSPDRVFYGSHAPFLVMEAGLIKVYESDLNASEISSLLSGNAVQLLSS